MAMKQLRSLAAPLLASTPAANAQTMSSLVDLIKPTYSVAEWLARDGPINHLAAGLMYPGMTALSKIGITPDNQYELAIAATISAWAWSTGPRLVWSAVGRPLGVWNPAWFEKFLIVPWRPFYQGLRDARQWWIEQIRPGGRPTAQWAGALERMCLAFNPSRGGVYAGRLQVCGIPLYQPCGFKTDKHFVMVAGAGSGKTTLVMTQLGMHRGNAFVIDPKGQITKAMFRRRGKGGNGIFGLGKKTRVLDPLRIVKNAPRASWNALDWIDDGEKREGRDAVVRYAATLVDGMIKIGQTTNEFFPKAARSFIEALVLFVWLSEKDPKRRNLLRVRELLTQGMPENARLVESAKPEEGKAPTTPKKEDGFTALLREMMLVKELDGVVAKRAAALAQTGKNAMGDVLATARQLTDWLDLPEVASISRHSDFRLHELKTGDLSLFVCAPVNDIAGKLSGWFRMLAVCALYDFEHIPGRPEHGCLFVLDEFPSLGRIEAVSTAAPVLRSFGVQLLAITQDLERLRMVYPDEWGGFLGNAECIWWLGTNHDETAGFLQNSLGTRAVKAVSYTHLTLPTSDLV